MTENNFRVVEEQLNYLEKGVAEIIPAEKRFESPLLNPPGTLRKKLDRSYRTGVPLRVYLGVDPTSPDIHLGHTVVIRKLKQFQDLGHTAIFLIGDFSAMIGDPTGRSETRPPLTREQVNANAKTYLAQVFKILDPLKTEVRYNSEWLDKLSSYDIVRLCGRYRLARMLEREDFRSRLNDSLPISVHELLYPLLTAWDAVELKSDVEIGATEQKFNLLVHRDIQTAVYRERAAELELENPGANFQKQEAQVCVTMPILVGLDGQHKMSKSLGNYVGITEAPGEMFGKLMSIPDPLMWKYYELLTDRSPDEIANLQVEVARGKVHPRDAKKALAQEIIAAFHGQEDARTAAENFRVQFSERGVPENVPWYKQAMACSPAKTKVSSLLFIGELAASRSDGERLIKQGAVEVDGVRVTEPGMALDVSEPKEVLIHAGKKFMRFKFVQT